MTHRLKYARIERERRFLLRHLPIDPGVDAWHRIEDRYLEGTRLRLRRSTGSDGVVRERKLTQKIDLRPSHRVITTIDLDEEEYARFATLPGAPLCKRRFRTGWRGVEFGIDVFEGPLAGLVLAEVETASDALLEQLPLPTFVHCEVTDRVELTGGRLATSDPAASLAFARRRLAEAPSAPTSMIGTDSLIVRELAPEDPPGLAAGFARMGWSKPDGQFRRYLDEHRAGERAALVAERNGALAGYVTIRWTADYVPFREAAIPEIQDLNVLAEHRRRGVASALLDEAEARIAPRAREAGIGVGLHPGYNAAQRLYGRRGYVPDGHGVTHRGNAVAEGESVPFDDDLVLHLIKPL